MLDTLKVVVGSRIQPVVLKAGRAKRAPPSTPRAYSSSCGGPNSGADYSREAEGSSHNCVSCGRCQSRPFYRVQPFGYARTSHLYVTVHPSGQPRTSWLCVKFVDSTVTRTTGGH